jgi:hypothetical protein
MKKIVLLLVVIGAIGLSSLAVRKTLHRLPLTSAVPSAIITDNNLYWTASVTDAAGYKKAGPSEGGQAVITQAQFKKDGTFGFIFSKINTLEQVQTETAVEGTIQFTKTEKGRNSFVTTATKATCRETKNGVLHEYAVSAKELASVYSGAWLWEKISFRDIPSEDFLLLVDLKAHPSAGNLVQGSIDKSWVTKFYIRK